MNIRGYKIKETRALFPTCVMEFDLSDSITDIEALLEIIDTSESTQHELIKNGKSSFHSGYNILDLETVRPIKQIIELCLLDYCSATGLDKVTIANSWWNKINRDGSLGFHRHTCSVVSGAFYPRISPNSSSLTFISPISQCKMNDSYNKYTEFSTQLHEFSVKQNHMYLFPSWLEHGVNTNNSEERTVISFNADRK
jgi:uncharacterized protein (TIGR02466 family)